ncbi:MAG: electron transfer subunit [Candidatus Ordinivivax streblomastigis]|uniref:Electron transfer subunit n=1 Tax=Candidatus Ordinivivax streblomastigis TaxID=2540710 RepID=A0A5M8P0A4_9BACT|nr:MAG: electron transfer subunit [Candidatus Ordinivivax streblomastigis]
MKKHIADWTVKENLSLHTNYCLLKLTSDKPLPEILPGQFVQVRVDGAQNIFLRRPISVHYVDEKAQELWLLIQKVGEGTRKLADLQVNTRINLIYPLGNTFTIPDLPNPHKKLLLIGGGVGIAPLLYLGKCLKDKGFTPTFILGARSEKDLLQLDEFSKLGTVHITTENGHLGEKGYVTNHSILQSGKVDFIYTCGPKPMMVSVAKYATKWNIPCEVSLENTMACGIGACLCCVEKTQKGNTCVCTEGPIFNIKELTWQI